MDEISLVKAKYDGAVKRERTGALVEVRDDWVVILYEPGRHTHHKSGERVDTDTGTHLFYVNTRLPLTALNYIEAGHLTGSYVDAALPGTFDGRVARYVDLELDIVAEIDAPPYVKDILEFENHRAKMAYPPGVVAAAWEGIRVGTEILAAGRFPFDGSAEEMARAALATMGR